LLHKIKNVTTALVQIPIIRNTLADVANLIVNTNLEKIQGENQYILSIDIGPQDIKKLFSSDQYLSGLLMQDARYIIPDVNAPKIPVVASILGIKIGDDINFGSVIALMCHTGEALLAPSSQFSNVFQTFDLRSAYTNNNSNYQSDNVSYHKGTILDDLGLSLLPTHDYDYAINTPCLESTESSLGFGFTANLFHNYQIILDTIVEDYEKTSPDYYVNYTTIGGEYQQYGIGLGAFFICIAMCVGTLTQIMVYDKKKRVRKIKAPK
jgi:hypothetical protein